MTIDVGTEVEVVDTPYFSVTNGTVAEVMSIRRNHFGAGLHLYELAGLHNRAFRQHELKERTAEVTETNSEPDRDWLTVATIVNHPTTWLTAYTLPVPGRRR